MPVKLFILGVPHTQTAARSSTCPFTMKTRMLCRVMRRLGHEVVYLGVEGAEVECSEQVAVVSAELYKRTFPSIVSTPRSPRFKKEDLETRSRGERRERNEGPGVSAGSARWRSRLGHARRRLRACHPMRELASPWESYFIAFGGTPSMPVDHGAAWHACPMNHGQVANKSSSVGVVGRRRATSFANWPKRLSNELGSPTGCSANESTSAIDL